MKKLLKYIVYTIIVYSTSSFASDRVITEKLDIKSLNIKFNKEKLKAFYSIIDLRTQEEKLNNQKEGRTKGPVIVFFHGHGQRPIDGYDFTSLLALKSMSGIVIIPVCDTPFGEDRKWRGDNGKDIILMELVRFALQKMIIEIDGYAPITRERVLFIDEREMESSPLTKKVHTKMILVGWSHGSILARRFAHAYSDATLALVQIVPAGYKHWGGENCCGPAKLTCCFGWESFRISSLIFKGHAKKVIGSSWGITKGIVGDSFRSCFSCIGDINPLKLFRSIRDIQDSALYCDDTNFPVPDLKHLVVLFGRDDSVMDVKDHAGIKNPMNPSVREIEEFWSKFYPNAVISGTDLTFKILPGNHIGPIIYADIYSDAILKSIGQIYN